jgi:hypothetical protein
MSITTFSGPIAIGLVAGIGDYLLDKNTRKALILAAGVLVAAWMVQSMQADQGN